MFYKSLTQLYAYLVCVGCVIGMLIAFNSAAGDLVDIVWSEPAYDRLEPEVKNRPMPDRTHYKVKALVKSSIAFISLFIVFVFHWRMAKRDKERLLKEKDK